MARARAGCNTGPHGNPILERRAHLGAAARGQNPHWAVSVDKTESTLGPCASEAKNRVWGFSDAPTPLAPWRRRPSPRGHWVFSVFHLHECVDAHELRD